MNDVERKKASEDLAWLPTKSTEDLEADLNGLSSSITIAAERLTDSRSLFQSISAELKRRREVKDEQPALLTREQRDVVDAEKAERFNASMVQKLIMMEAEQAKLVIELEQEKWARKVAEDRLALVVKYQESNSKPQTDKQLTETQGA